MHPEGAEQPATAASPTAPRHAPGFRSEEGNHIHNQICMEMLDLPPPPLLPPPLLPQAGPEAGHQDTMPVLSRHREQLFSQYPEASHDPTTCLTHCCTHRAGERGNTLPVQPHRPQPTHRPCLPGLFLKSTQTSSLSQYPAPQCPGALPASPECALEQRGLHRHACSVTSKKKHAPPKRSSRTPWAALAKLWAHGQHVDSPPLAKKTGPEQRFGGCRHTTTVE